MYLFLLFFVNVRINLVVLNDFLNPGVAMRNTVLTICFFSLLLMIFGCSDSYRQHYQLGKWYYEKGLINESILEFKAASRANPDSYQVHYSLAIAYTKKEWYDYALKEAEIAFDLHPSDEHYSLIQIIKQNQTLEMLKSAEPPE